MTPLREASPTMITTTKTNTLPESKIKHHATVTYTDGTSEVFEALQVTDRGIAIGRLYSTEKGDEFVTYGLIPFPSIKQITALP